jgi:hypothetical protein
LSHGKLAAHFGRVLISVEAGEEVERLAVQFDNGGNALGF